jgi:hypothetical protein
MNFAITGHTQGIGQHLYKRLSPNIIGFSKSTGYDINSNSDRERICKESKNCDVFINNAHSKFGQVYMLIDLVDRWKHDPTKTIINIGSRVAEMELPYSRFELIKYQAEKKALKETIVAMSMYSEIKCTIKYKWFGYVGTEKILQKYPHFTVNDYITLDQACDIILS